MTLTVGSVLVVLALVFLVVAAMGRAPLWAAVLCLVLDRIVALVGR